ncbi:NAD(P)H-hydrate epimerase [Paracoccus marinaquae]|uniref:Bifunctional NAD(P)H-hydrate repair enzyme n=1 Tax=Paracoccus marinaquae TaxID=2841926 RepID=A0ABS6AG65_9RHOB|nr:NAD(P)H-hydrate epimerase [Paracoccus marinaquae]MBU3029216.1 NAD(P)H-hydrate epimerase [Paracoccus marinaquae]
MLNGTEILTTAQMRAIETAAMDSGAVTGLDLMERAGAAVAGQIRLRWPKPGQATVLCGPGNNGGDGYVIARLLHRAGWRLRVLGLDNIPGPDAAEMKRRWCEIGPIEALTGDALRRPGESSDVYVDAIFGTGLARPPEGAIADILRYLGGSGGDRAFFRERLVAVDCPSGLCMDSGAFLGRRRQPGDYDLQARLTVAFDSPKPGHLLERGPESCGELVIADIGLQDWRIIEPGRARSLRPPALTAIWPLFAIPDRRRMGFESLKRGAWLAKRESRAGHKFEHGHALIIAGDFGHGGAARLAARAALRAGAGLVTICPPRSAMVEHLGPPDALMRRPVDEAADLARILEDKRITALCLGPGCGVDRAAELLPVALASGRACLLDADALTALAASGLEGLHADCVLTPHRGEFARLFPDLAERLAGPQPPGPTGDPDQQSHDRDAYRAALAGMHGPAFSKIDAARAAAGRAGATVLLKGPDTVIAEPSRARAPRLDRPGRAAIHSAFDVPWLATAGAGDVLAGLITGLLARDLNPFSAATTGAWLHAAAARQAGPGLIADDLPERIPDVLDQAASGAGGDP